MGSSLNLQQSCCSVFIEPGESGSLQMDKPFTAVGGMDPTIGEGWSRLEVQLVELIQDGRKSLAKI